jgi:hypothetical protein
MNGQHLHTRFCLLRLACLIILNRRKQGKYMKRFEVYITIGGKDKGDALVNLANIIDNYGDLNTIFSVREDKSICTFNACKNIQYTDDNGFQHDICKRHFKDGIND